VIKTGGLMGLREQAKEMNREFNEKMMDYQIVITWIHKYRKMRAK
jgi:hypothetical protein